MRLRRTVTLTLTAALLLSGCTDDSKKVPAGQTVEIVAGGGTDPNAAKAVDAQLAGKIDDFGVGRDGVVRVLTTDNGRVAIRLIYPDGRLQRIDLDPEVLGASQLAVADNGTMYVSHSRTGTGAVSRVESDGRLVPVLGNGQGGFTPDGGPALAPAGYVEGIAVDRQGRLVYGEGLSDQVPANHANSLLRRIEANGTVKTIGGSTAFIQRDDDYQRAILRSVAPPLGAKALGWPIAGALQLQSLAVDGGGTVFAQSRRGVLAFAPDGTISSAARQRDPEAAPVGDRPFTDEGDAADAEPRFDSSHHPGITEGDGYLAMVVRRPTDRPPAFRWSGDFTAGQQAVIDGVDGQDDILRLVKPDGRLTTAAWLVQGGAVSDGQVYVLIAAKDGHFLVGKIALPA
jgi:hypothetical protein